MERDTVVTDSKTTQRLQLELVPVAAMVAGILLVVCLSVTWAAPAADVDVLKNLLLALLSE